MRSEHAPPDKRPRAVHNSAAAAAATCAAIAIAVDVTARDRDAAMPPAPPPYAAALPPATTHVNGPPSKRTRATTARDYAPLPKNCASSQPPGTALLLLHARARPRPGR